MKQLNEIKYTMYQTLVYVEFDAESNITHIAQVLRSLKYVTVVNNKTDKTDLNPRGLLSVKILTSKSGHETFELVRKDALQNIPELKKFKYSLQQLHTVEEM
jgi:hypothetical protein